MSRNMVPLLDNPRGEALVRTICEEKNISFDAFRELVYWECAQIGKGRKNGMTSQFNDILDRIEIEEAE